MVTREQVRMARAALGWGVRELAARAGVTPNTVSRFENGADALGQTLGRIQRALEAGGVVFIFENGGGPGVRLKAPSESPAKDAAEAALAAAPAGSNPRRRG